MRTYIILLNWNGWRDTIACLESLQLLDYRDYRIVVCDNASQDDSLTKIRNWAEGRAPVELSSPDSHNIPLPAPKVPILYQQLNEAQVNPGSVIYDTPLTLIQNSGNHGFAGGNNVGIRYSLRDPDCSFIWLLNNDTVVHADTLSALVAKATTNPRIGAVSSICYYSESPTQVEAWAGARVNLWIGFARTLGLMPSTAQVC
jgi:GT2 family glycosyltransferase